MNKIQCVSDPDLETEFPKKWKASVTIEAGQTITQNIVYPKGDPENPLTKIELDEKFQTMIKDIYNNNKSDTIVNDIKILDQYEDLKDFISSLNSK